MRLSTLDLNLLRALDMLLQESSVTRAAERLFVTQQAMSGTLKRLREQFGDELLVQVGRRLEPTPLGTALIKPVQEIMLQIARVVETQPTFDAALSSRSFRMAMSDYAQLIIGQPLMSELCRFAPGVTCHFRPLEEAVWRDLDVGLLEFALLPVRWPNYNNELPASIRSTTLFQDDYVCVVDVNNPVREVMTMEDYVSLPHCTTGWYQTIVQNAWTRSYITPKIAATSGTFTSLVPLVVGTPMIATVQRRLAIAFEDCWPIRVLECPIPIEPVVQQLSWHERNVDDPAHLFVRDCFVRAAAESSSRD